jgi:hypothetical protein
MRKIAWTKRFEYTAGAFLANGKVKPAIRRNPGDHRASAHWQIQFSSHPEFKIIVIVAAVAGWTTNDT